MDALWPYLGDLHQVLPRPWADIVLVLCSILCGLIAGVEREAKDKPAGLKTVSLICVGSTIYTVTSLLISAPQYADPGRVAAQVVTGVGFLGAGAILRDRGTIIGLTTGATIWTVAAIGVLIGVGYAAAAFALTVAIVSLLTAIRLIERQFIRACRMTECRLLYRPDRGKTRLRIMRILDQYRIADGDWHTFQQGELEGIEIRYCHFHREHRAFLLDLSRLRAVVEIHSHPVPPTPS